MSIDQMIRELRSLEEKNENRTYSTFEVKWRDVCHDTAGKLEEVVTEISKLRDTVSASTGETKQAFEELLDQQQNKPKIDLGLVQFYSGRYSAQVEILKDLETLMSRIGCERNQRIDC